MIFQYTNKPTDSSICVIPARGGSKRIPRKNIRNFCGKPMIVWSIETALSCSLFEHVIVSTDDPFIAEVAKSAGAAVPFMRPNSLSDDFTGTREVIQHSITKLIDLNYKFDSVCCLYATAPFVLIDDILKAYRLYLSSPDCQVVFAATTFSHPIERALTLDEQGIAHALYPNKIQSRTQDLMNCFHDIGQFYWASCLRWSLSKSLINDAIPIIIPSSRAHDIDTEEDWQHAELLMRILNQL
jgi:pseudaminic acid cytidylyltransferase